MASCSRTSIAIVGSVNFDAMAVTTTSGLRPVTASVVHNGSTVVATLNGRRLLLDHPDRDRELAAGGPHSHADVDGGERRPDVDAVSEPSNRGTP